MTEDTGAWFAGLDPEDAAGAADRIESGRADEPADWPQQAVESGFAADEAEYYERLQRATITATEAAVHERETAGDQQLVHAVRAMADCERTANELAERVAEWGGSRYGESGSGVEYAREIAERASENRGDEALRSLAERTVSLSEEADELRAFIERTAPAAAPNLSALAGPVLAARLISLAGGLEPLAKQPSGTVQVLGAEDALFAHLKGNAPSPKHGIIFTHKYVSGTRREERGSAARALAGKLSIAARVDHYSGERKPELDAELDERIERIRSRGGDAE
ncbi:NOP58 family protein [Halomicroarcula limicola]|uniref:NOP58 family protein n=1 Tax=Haloarcula limicola TaxID=1429915 RepID=A0A8J7Y9K5_9EURY|nr:NOP5/NOP56 family protein [Halomicroarcula limicola]MBV0923226.1 NOP58 family protein [Halomicroarcula limicola]